MEIKFYGHACFSITDGGITVVTDPFENEIGLQMPNLKADAVTVSHMSPAHGNADVISGDPKIFGWPGEYETKGIHFKMIHSFHNAKDDQEQLENNILVIHWGDISLCHLGAQGLKLTAEQLEQVGDIDILFVPVGGKVCLDAKQAKDLIEQIEPRVIIPMCYHTDGSELGLAPLSQFLSIMGAKIEEPLDSFKVKRVDLPEDSSKIIVLSVSR